MPFGICAECNLNRHCKTVPATKKFNEIKKKQVKDWKEASNMLICRDCYTGETPWDLLGH